MKKLFALFFLVLLVACAPRAIRETLPQAVQQGAQPAAAADTSQIDSAINGLDDIGSDLNLSELDALDSDLDLGI